MKILIPIFVLLILLYGGCVERWVETEQFGIFTKTEYWTRDRFGDTGIKKTKVCTPGNKLCFKDKFVHVGDSGAKAIKIRLPFKDEDYIYDKNTGEPISCLNCESEDYFERVIRHNLRWFKQGKFAIAQDGGGFYEYSRNPDGNSLRRTIWLLEIRESGAVVSEISPGGSEYEYGSPYELRISPDGESMAWFICAPECVLWQYDFERETHTATPTPCDFDDFSSYWVVGWKDGKAIPQNYWSEPKTEICLLDDGSKAFQTQERPDW